MDRFFLLLAVNCQSSGLHVSKNALYEHTQCCSAFACHVSLIDDSVYPCYSIMHLLGPLITNMPRAFPYVFPWSSVGSIVVSYVQFWLFWVQLFHFILWCMPPVIILFSPLLYQCLSHFSIHDVSGAFVSFP